MQTTHNEKEVSTTEARQGRRRTGLLNVMAIGIVIALIGMLLAFAITAETIFNHIQKGRSGLVRSGLLLIVRCWDQASTLLWAGWKKSAWPIAAFTVFSWNGFGIR